MGGLSSSVTAKERGVEVGMLLRSRFRSEKHLGEGARSLLRISPRYFPPCFLSRFPLFHARSHKASPRFRTVAKPLSDVRQQHFRITPHAGERGGYDRELFAELCARHGRII